MEKLEPKHHSKHYEPNGSIHRKAEQIKTLIGQTIQKISTSVRMELEKVLLLHE
jgi:hypothetical protein